jgi:hypothetical protein
VLGGHHHQQFNYLHARFDVAYLLLGETALFDSSIAAFEAPILARAKTLVELYRAVLPPIPSAPVSVLIAPAEPVAAKPDPLELAPYFFPEILNRRALAFPPEEVKAAAAAFARTPGVARAWTLCLNDAERQAATRCFPNAETADELRPDDSYASLTCRIAERWKTRAKGVAFGDPPAILSQLAWHCRQRRVAVFGNCVRKKNAEVIASSYAEASSCVAQETARLCEEIGNPVIVGRQTGDGDLFEWSKKGCCIQIIDPNRPAFPIVEEVPHKWTAPARSPADLEPSGEQLREYAKQGKVLVSLLAHSGEVAHNEAMLNFCELACTTGLKMGLAVHAQRYETCPQQWELLAVPREKGGVLGLIEPVLHSGGLGVLAECNCPPDRLREHCRNALARIREIAGEAGTPRGYYAFMDSDLDTLTRQDNALFAAIADAGLDYIVSSVRPGRNRVLWRSGDCVAINQSCRVLHTSSPFVRITTPEDLDVAAHLSPGWLIGTLDAPVISFQPYIWREGARFMKIVDRVMRGGWINETPHVVARYARLLQEGGQLPEAGA